MEGNTLMTIMAISRPHTIVTASAAAVPILSFPVDNNNNDKGYLY